MTEKPTMKIEDFLADTTWLRDLARRLVGDAARADDAVQEALIAAWTRPPERADNPRGWMAVVLRNAVRQMARGEQSRRRREVASHEGSTSPSTAELVEKIDTGRLVARLATELDEPFRTAVLLRFYDGKSAAAIARQLDVPEGTVRWRIHEGLKRLRGRLDSEFDGDRKAWCTLLLPLAGEKGWIGIVGWVALLKGIATMKTVQTAAVVLISGLLWWGFSSTPAQVGQDGRAVARAPVGPGAVPAGAVVNEPATDRRPATPGVAVTDDATLGERDAALELLVIDPLGQPIEGADVVLVEVPSVKTRSGGDGRARLEGTVTDEYLPWIARPVHVRVELAGYAVESVSGRIELGGTVELGEVVLVRSGRVVGQVVDERGAPLAGVAVRPDATRVGRLAPGVGSSLRPVLIETITDRAGRFDLDGIRASRLTISATRDGFHDGESDELTVRAGETTNGVVITMRRSRPDEDRDLTCRGVVLDGHGEPLPTGAVRVRHVTANGGGGDSRVITDSAGRFDWSGRGVEVVSVRAMDRERRWRSAERSGPVEENIELRLAAPARLTIDAVDAAGQPVAQPEVRSREVGDERTVWVWSADDSDRVSLMLPIRPFTLAVSAEGYGEVELGPFDPETVDDVLRCTLPEIVGVRGRVEVDGEPVVGALVEARVVTDRAVEIDGFPSRLEPQREAEDVTAEDGSFALTLREPAPLMVVVRAEGYAPVEVGPFDFDPAVGVRDVVIELGPGGAIEGRVLLPARRSPVGVIVAASRGDGATRTTRITSPDGRFRFDHLTPGPWWIGEAAEIVDPRRSSTWSASPGRPYVPVGNCEVREGQTTRFDLDLTRCRVLGEVRLGDRAPAGASVTLRSGGLFFGLGATEHRAIVDPQGAFVVDAPRAGTYELVVDAGGRLRITQEVELVRGDQAWRFVEETAPLDVVGAADGDYLSFRRAGVTGWMALPVDASGVARVDVPVGAVDAVRFRDAPTFRRDDADVVGQVKILVDGANRIELNEPN